MSSSSYYSRRAAEYDRIYERPERREDLSALRSRAETFARGRRVLEIACGTGYWTELLARSALSVTAFDLASTMLGRAEERLAGAHGVRLLRANAFGLEEIPGTFDAAFAGFFWSHVPLARLDGFLAGLHRRMEPGSRILFLDNRFVEGNSTRIAGRDREGNTYQKRSLDDGSEHLVQKNFPDAATLAAAVGRAGSEITVTELKYYWCLSYRLPGMKGRSLPRQAT